MKRLFWLLLLLSSAPHAHADCSPGSQSINIRDCGAICDGIERHTDTRCDPTVITDDDCAINTALDIVGQAGGGEVYIPPGTCIISPRPATQPNPFLRLYNNLTIRGSGRKSILKVHDGNGTYDRIFANAPGVNPLQNVVIKDFAIDQNPNHLDAITSCNSAPLGDNPHCVIAPFSNTTPDIQDTHVITISGMFFDPTDAVNTIWIANRHTTIDLQATITNNYFRFQHCATVGWYDVSTVLLDGSQQVITNNTFTSTLPDLANTAIESLGGRNVIANNTIINYILGYLCFPVIPPVLPYQTHAPIISTRPIPPSPTIR